MNLLDSSAWLEFFAASPLGAEVRPLVQNIEDMIVPTVCLLEVYKVVLRERGQDAAEEAISAMSNGQIISLDESLALRAAQSKLPLADSIIWATAQAYDATIWTMDSHFAGMPKVRYFPKS